MRSTKLLLLSAISSIIFLFSCQKEMSSDVFVPTTNPVNTAPNISASVMGRVTDEFGKPVSGAEVKSPTVSVFTNINGEFTLQNVSLYDNAAYVQVVKAGYFTGSRTFIARAGQTHYVEVKLIPKINNGSINSAAGGTVALANGASVTLPASGVVNKLTNAAYTGTVEVSVAWIDPTSADLEREMPGDLRGLDNNNVEMGMQSFGMLAVELRGSAGELLQIASGKKASLKFPLPSSITSTAPASIALWSFNETTGIWKQEGTATKVGNAYEGEVSHFSYWNCDFPYPAVEITMTFKDQNGKPLVHTQVDMRVSGTNTSGGHGYTDSVGVIKGRVPANKVLTVRVYSTCNTVTYTQDIGPFSGPSSVNITANLTGLQTATITGTVLTCTNTPVINGSVELITGQRAYRAKVVNGVYTLSLTLCNGSQAGNIVAVDSGVNQQGTSSITITPGANNVAAITACGVSTTQFIDFTVSGTAYNLAPPGDSLVAGLTNAATSFVQGSRSTAGGGQTSNLTYISFNYNGAAIGSFPLTSISLRVPAPTGLDSASMQGVITVAITEYGGPGLFVAGSYSGTLKNLAGTTFPIQCSFRVRRRQ